MVGDNESINASFTECEPLQDILQNVGLQDILMVSGIYCFTIVFSQYFGQNEYLLPLDTD